MFIYLFIHEEQERFGQGARDGSQSLFGTGNSYLSQELGVNVRSSAAIHCG
jgi:hypothetical protein